jgi:hypothetical protein
LVGLLTFWRLPRRLGLMAKFNAGWFAIIFIDSGIKVWSGIPVELRMSLMKWKLVEVLGHLPKSAEYQSTGLFLQD